MDDDFLEAWLELADDHMPDVHVYLERAGTRDAALRAVRRRVLEHFLGIDTILKAGGFVAAANVIRNSLPTTPKMRSGDLGELIAVELLHHATTYRVPFAKLRHKSDRNTALHGNDVIAVDTTARRPRILKGECKSRVRFSPSHIEAAAAELDGHGGRPNPSTLAFITKRLYEENRDEEAAYFRDLQATNGILLRDMEHFLFLLAGNNPHTTLSSLAPSASTGIHRRWAAAVVVEGHAQFVAASFEVEYGS